MQEGKAQPCWQVVVVKKSLIEEVGTEKIYENRQSSDGFDRKGK